MRAAGAEGRGANGCRGAGAVLLRRVLASRQGVQIGVVRHLAEDRRHGVGDGRHVQLADRRQHRACARLAKDRRLVGASVEEQALELLLDERTLRLHDQHAGGVAHGILHEIGVERPGHAELHEPDARLDDGVGRPEAQLGQALANLRVDLASARQHKSRLGTVGNHAVDAVGGGEAGRQGLFRPQPRFLGQRRVCQSDAGVFDSWRRRVVPAVQPNHHGAVGDVGCHQQPGPAAGVARQRPAEQAEVEHILHVGRRQHWNAQVAQRELAGARQRGGLAARVVADHQQCAAERARARRVGMTQRVGGAIQPGGLAVPHSEYAVVARAGEQPDLLAAPDGCCREVFVQAGLEDDVLRVELGGGLPEADVQAPEGRTAIAGDETGGVLAVSGVRSALFQRQLRQRLDAGQESRRLA